MAMKFKMEGAGDIERALADLARGTAKGAVRRAMKKTLKPVAEAAEGLSGGKFKVAVTSKLTARQQRDARMDRGRSKLALYVGPVMPDGDDAPHAHLYEFGTAPRFHKETGKSVGAMPARPFMRPAWDANQAAMLETLKREIWAEIEKTVERARRKAERAAK
ncbi:HK97-gp10 family putative phage morphogenesis protein [Leisingera sp.]|uniref:HK97-gp10 family putative phage morphogenesis protein n=1 Tax=Leisingera sp. TaxID=1879318 RepID=UPI002B270FC0|nr:HK97-gp10 family putative phage morphogenesis protein [Leisingera sp.]